MKVFASVVIDAPIGKIWEVLRDFVGLTVWSGAVTGARIVNGKAADQVGAVRHLDIVDGTVFIETLVALSDEETFLKYDIVEGPLPVTNYVATMRLQPVTEGNLTYASWSAEFDTADEHVEGMREAVGGQICAGGLRAMKAYFESK
ncbi:MAG: SRPBCC family protein [Chloroflexota bacterium]